MILNHTSDNFWQICLPNSKLGRKGKITSKKSIWSFRPSKSFVFVALKETTSPLSTSKMGLSRRIDLFCLMFSFCSFSPGKARRRRWKREERMKMENGAANLFIPKPFLFFFRYSITNILESWVWKSETCFPFLRSPQRQKNPLKLWKALVHCAKEESPCDFGLVCYYDRNFLQSSKK